MIASDLATSVEQVQNWLRAHESDLLSDFQTLLRFPSIESEVQPNAPFGQANRDALDFMLGLGEQWGMTTKDIEGYCGYAEFGTGERMIGVFGHLDVVPVGPGWKHDPFSATIDGDYVYSRGAVDDKGPTIAAFYAARAIQATCPCLGARLRIVFGCDEESGFQCIERYNETEEAPTLGVAPDSGWPLYHAEKGIANLLIDRPLIRGAFELVSIAGGQRPNIVIDSCDAVVKVAATAREHVNEKLAEAWDRNISTEWNGDSLHIHANGKAAHGSTPFQGDSAAIRVLRLLKEIAPLPEQPLYDALFECTHISGAGIGIHGADEPSGDLTCNLGIIETLAGQVRMTFNVRYPVTWSGEILRAKCEAALKELGNGYVLADLSDSKPLYFPLDHPLVKTICEVYTSETGDTKKPGVMGGGTYARAIPNTVSIGTGWEGDGDAHQTNERLKIEHLYKMSRIYAHILLRLLGNS